MNLKTRVFYKHPKNTDVIIYLLDFIAEDKETVTLKVDWVHERLGNVVGPNDMVVVDKEELKKWVPIYE